MPTLQFKGKNIIWNHHLSVPYHALKEVEKLHFQPEKGDGNIIVEGDNLIALKALLPQYAGKIKCIYIDPPYNTGNEGWAYNDKVNSPLMREWLNKSVGSDDLTKHDKWLCMMVPRLKLLQELLSEKGAIYISIDHNEVHHLRSIMDDIFGESNFLGQVSRATGTPTGLGNKGLASELDYIIIYSKGDSDLFNGLPMDEEQKKIYDQEDSSGKYLTRPLRKTGGEDKREDRPSMYYPVISPKGKKVFPIGPSGYESRWRCSEDKFKLLTDQGMIEWKNDRKGTLQPYLKFYAEGRLKQPTNLWQELDGNKKASIEVKKLFGQKVFDFPKPVDLIKRCMEIYTDKDSIILDSFSGSGTTMHAVMDLNKQDGGNRKCIMVQMTEATEDEPKKNVCRDITRKRVELAIKKHGFNSGFKYLKVGTPIDPETMLEGELPTFTQFAEYVFYLATGSHLADKKKIDAKASFVGNLGSQSVYLIYEQDIDKLTRLALTLDKAKEIVKHSPGKRRTVFAPSCFLDEEYMEAMQIDFVSVPYNLFERKTNG